jgi:glutamyl-tRNA synthetase
VTFKNNGDLDDLVLLRADGAPTYNLAVVVDDHDMGVTHVIRGDDHLNNAARQTPDLSGPGLGRAGLRPHPADPRPGRRQAVSKRHGAQAVGEFADMGYLPEAMRNYLARLGWGHGDDEVFNDEQAIELVRRQGRGQGAGAPGLGQAGHINAQHLRWPTTRAWPTWS